MTVTLDEHVPSLGGGQRVPDASRGDPDRRAIASGCLVVEKQRFIPEVQLAAAVDLLLWTCGTSSSNPGSV